MPRNTGFRPGHEPHEGHPGGLRLHRKHVSGPFSFLNPTSARYAPSLGPTTDQAPDQIPEEPAPAAKPEHVEHLWRSRDNRKGRHALRIDYDLAAQEPGYSPPPPTSTFKAAAQGILRMVTKVPYWDVSYLVATTFTFGSVVWIINAFFVWLPLADPQTAFPRESTYGAGILGCVGATIFEIGSVLLLLEAINANQTGCFGWALETVLSKAESDSSRSITKVEPNIEECSHHHANRKNLVGTGQPMHHHHHFDDLAAGYVTTSANKSFRWMPSLTELKTHYMHELGFLASLTQFIAATIFWIAGITGVPGILNNMSPGLTIGVFWVPQMVGGLGFILSGLLFTLETQEKWYKPAFHVLGWHIGAWNLIGGIGFTLCGALGPATSNSGVAYESTLATFWGSWAFMVGSTIQWYESLQKHPVERK